MSKLTLSVLALLLAILPATIGMATESDVDHFVDVLDGSGVDFIHGFGDGEMSWDLKMRQRYAATGALLIAAWLLPCCGKRSTAPQNKPQTGMRSGHPDTQRGAPAVPAPPKPRRVVIKAGQKMPTEAERLFGALPWRTAVAIRFRPGAIAGVARALQIPEKKKNIPVSV